MQLTNFRVFLKKIIKEGNRLQKVDINGQVTTKRWFTDMQLIALVLAIIGVWILKHGFSHDFARDIVVFLGIFVGLFAGVVISLHDKSKDLLKGFEEKSQPEQAQIRRIKNYLFQFTGLAAYAIVLAIGIIILLVFNLLFESFHLDIWEYTFVKRFTVETFLCLVQIAALVVHRFLVLYWLVNFFVLTLFAISSYFSYLLNDYKNTEI